MIKFILEVLVLATLLGLIKDFVRDTMNEPPRED